MPEPCSHYSLEPAGSPNSEFLLSTSVCVYYNPHTSVVLNINILFFKWHLYFLWYSQLTPPYTTGR